MKTKGTKYLKPIEYKMKVAWSGKPSFLPRPQYPQNLRRKEILSEKFCKYFEESAQKAAEQAISWHRGCAEECINEVDSVYTNRHLEFRLKVPLKWSESFIKQVFESQPCQGFVFIKQVGKEYEATVRIWKPKLVNPIEQIEQIEPKLVNQIE